MEQLGLGLDFDLENLTLGFPWKCHSGCQRNSNLPTSGHGRRNCYIQSQMNAGKPQEKRMDSRRSRTQVWKDEIKFEDFDKVEIRVAEVKGRGTRRRIRQIASLPPRCRRWRRPSNPLGIAKFYPNEQELVGRNFKSLANLKPRKMMKKYVSQGMILSAEHGDQLTVLTVDPSKFKWKHHWVENIIHPICGYILNSINL